MRLSEAARRLNAIALDAWCGAGSDGYCIACDRSLRGPDGRHDPDCEVLMLPRIVATLEAADRLTTAWQMPGSSIPIPGSMGGFSLDWDRGQVRHDAIQDASEALVAALRETEA